MNAPSLVDQNILITGAAGRIGSAVAKLCLAHGATVLLADISTKSLDRLLLDLSSFETDRIYSFVADTSTAAGINSLVELASSSTGCIDAAVHCAYPRSNGWGTKFEDIQDHQLFEDLNMQLGGAILHRREAHLHELLHRENSTILLTVFKTPPCFIPGHFSKLRKSIGTSTVTLVFC